MQDELVDFISRLLASTVPENLIGEARQQLRMVDEYESISDYVGRIVKYHVNLLETGEKYDAVERDHLATLHGMVATYLDTIESAYRSSQREMVGVPDERGKNIAQEVRQLRRQVVDRMSENAVSPNVSIAYNRVINSYRRIRDHAVNIVEAMAGAK